MRAQRPRSSHEGGEHLAEAVHVSNHVLESEIGKPIGLGVAPRLARVGTARNLTHAVARLAVDIGRVEGTITRLTMAADGFVRGEDAVHAAVGLVGAGLGSSGRATKVLRHE